MPVFEEDKKMIVSSLLSSGRHATAFWWNLEIDPNLALVRKQKSFSNSYVNNGIIMYAEDTKDSFQLWNQNNKSDINRLLRAYRVLHILAIRRWAKPDKFSFPNLYQRHSHDHQNPSETRRGFNFHKPGAINEVMVRRCPITCCQTSRSINSIHQRSISTYYLS